MPTFPFHYITDPPNDENVNEGTQLNENWDILERKLSFLQDYISIPTSELSAGVETRRPSGSFSALDGGGIWRQSTSIPDNWSAWTLFPIKVNFVNRTGYECKYRTNSATRMIQIQGNVYNSTNGTSGTAGIAWPKGVWNNVCETGIPAAFAPVNGKVLMHCSGSQALTAGTTGGVLMAHRLLVTNTGIGGACKLEVHWMGGDGGGNFVAFDNMAWWY